MRNCRLIVGFMEEDIQLFGFGETSSSHLGPKHSALSLGIVSKASPTRLNDSLSALELRSGVFRTQALRPRFPPPSSTLGCVRKRHLRMLYLCLTHEALIREKEYPSSGVFERSPGGTYLFRFTHLVPPPESALCLASLLLRSAVAVKQCTS